MLIHSKHAVLHAVLGTNTTDSSLAQCYLVYGKRVIAGIHWPQAAHKQLNASKHPQVTAALEC